MKSLLLALVLAVTACGASSAPQPIAFTACPTQHTASENGYSTVVCDATYPALPKVHLPDDVVAVGDGESTIYVALDLLASTGPGQLLDRDGKSYVATTDDGSEIQIGGVGETHTPAGFELPSYRFVYTVYQVSGTIGTTQKGGVTMPSIAIHAAQPVLRIAADALDGELLGTWEGHIAKRTGDLAYDANDTTPIRVTVSALGRKRDLIVWDDVTEFLVGHELDTPPGTVDNLDEAVTLADGSCAPSLASFAGANPFFGATSGDVKLYRMMAMHVPGDYQLVFDFPAGTPFGNGMGSMLPAHPAALMQTAARDAYTETSSGPHGTPIGQSLTGFHRVSGGGAACAP